MATSLDPLATALARKADTGAAGAAVGTTLAEGEGWRVADIVCTSGPMDRPFEERQPSTTISLVVSGTFVYQSERGFSLLSPGSLLLGNLGETFECSHPHGEGDRCLSFQFDTDFFERIACETEAPRVRFERDQLAPLRELAALTTRAQTAVTRKDSLEEIAIELAASSLRMSTSPSDDREHTPSDSMRIARVLRLLEAHPAEPHPIVDLAATAGLSRYHFLRTFKRVTGTTPHQWLLRTRLRTAAQRLADTQDPITQIALAVGFEDLSNFTRSFRAEFGMSPRVYRVRA